MYRNFEHNSYNSPDPREMSMQNEYRDRDLDLDAEMDMELETETGRNAMMNADASTDDDDTRLGFTEDSFNDDGPGDSEYMGQSLADEFEMEMDMEGGLDEERDRMGGVGTLAGELDRELGTMGKMQRRNINSHQTSLTTSPDLTNPQTPPNRHLALPDPSPGLSGFSSRGSSPGYSGNDASDVDAHEHPSFTSTRYYTAYSPEQLSRVQAIQAKSGIKGKASFASMVSSGHASDSVEPDDVFALLEEDGSGRTITGDTMRDMLEGKMRTEQLGNGVGLGGVPMPSTKIGQAHKRTNVGTNETPSKYGGPKLQRDPMVVIEQCMADTNRFLRTLRDFDAPNARAQTAKSDDVTTQKPDTKADEPNDETRAEDEAIANYIHDLTTRERKLDDRQREIERLAEKWEEARYGAGFELDMTDVQSAISDMAIMTPLPVMATYLSPLIRDPLPDTLSHLSETLHTQSSLLISTGRQLRAIRQAVQTAQEGLRNEEIALAGIEAWEAERVREGLRGGKRCDALRGLSEGLSEIWDKAEAMVSAKIDISRDDKSSRRRSAHY